MTTDDAQRRRSLRGKVDFTMMYAAHDAFQRDLRRLTAVVGAGRTADPAVRAGWETFKIHHAVEDEALWPPLRQKVIGSDEASVLDAMEAEHARIDPLLSRVDASFAAADGAALAENAGALAAALEAHMEHEEDQALPLVEARLGPEGWAGFIKAIRARQGLRGAAEAGGCSAGCPHPPGSSTGRYGVPAMHAPRAGTPRRPDVEVRRRSAHRGPTSRSRPIRHTSHLIHGVAPSRSLPWWRPQ
jgi:hypothetical protein